MCGIAGYLGSKKISLKKIKKLSILMKNRGPEFFNFIEISCKKKILYLFHSRLKIIDLSNKANQPFSYKGYVLIFNGEIYNYKEIKKKLIIKGYKFISNSDTEVLLYSYIEYGENFLSFFDGMWSLAIWDPKKELLYLSRDRFGEKPLYIKNNNNSEFFFGSETKYIQVLDDEKLKINKNLVRRNLLYGYKSINKTNETFFKNIYSLEPASLVHLKNNGNFIIKKYWRPQFNEKKKGNVKSIIKNIRMLFKSSLKNRLIADVPIAVMLSGGIDSSIIMGLVKKLNYKNISSFSLIDKGSYNEKQMILKTCKFLKIKNNFININYSNFFKKLREVIKYQNQPLLTITYFAQNEFMKKVSKSNFKVILSGTGADEIFSGYYDHYRQFLSQANKKDVKLYLDMWDKNFLPFICNSELANCSRYIENIKDRSFVYETYKKNLKFFKFKINNRFHEKFYSKDLLRNRMLNELFYETTPVNLNHEDLNCMQYSLENRSPFLNKNLFEFMSTVPTKYLVYKGKLKYLLRNSFKKQLHSKVFTNNQKVGFNASLSLFLKNERKKNIKSFFLDDKVMKNYVDMKMIYNLIEKNEFNPQTNKLIFNVISTKIFLENYQRV
jgi:asparagine synthase (glutamine-hydrolysing)